jgi:hypothetical protein
LQNARGNRIDHVSSGDRVTERETQFSRFPVQVLERPSEAELKDWHERTDDLVMA